jgi:hypothetical protein
MRILVVEEEMLALGLMVEALFWRAFRPMKLVTLMLR